MVVGLIYLCLAADTPVKNEPFVAVGYSKEKPLAKFSGFIPDLLDRISSILNVTFVINHVGDGKYGSINEYGNWTGLIGELKNNVSDIAAAPLTVTAERAQHIHFSHPFITTGLRILIKKPEISTPLRDDIFLVFTPFSIEIWLIVILAIIGVSVQFFIIGRYNPEELIEKKGHVNMTLTNSFFFTFSMLTWQGFSVTPKSHSARILAAFWWLFAFITIITYIANVTALLLTRSPSKPIVPFYTFEEMTKQNSINYGFLKRGSSTAYHFKTSPYHTDKKILDFVTKHPDFLVDSTAMGIGMVRTQNFAFIMEGAAAESAAAHAPCNMMVVGEEKAKRHYAFACRPDLDVCRDLDIAILKLKEFGEINKLLLKYLSGPCENYKADMLCSLSEYGLPLKTDINATKTINLKRFAGPLILLFLGMFLSLIVMFVEIYMSKRHGIVLIF
ncbi:hypothetical protein KUTeg_012191 [Tegillarca granosa]|uniref:Uncharacterized protein n=1 Tax=Tegillarca granosa TaxID=220873 RepID=A0ABQ9EYT9_TEGGR|nr:hypothetical protein KUTeg_012191 [Tegillarca granosa]